MNISNNNSSTYGTSKTYSGRKTRDCKQIEEQCLSKQECLVALYVWMVSLRDKNIRVKTVVLETMVVMKSECINIIFQLEKLSHVGSWFSDPLCQVTWFQCFFLLDFSIMVSTTTEVSS